MTLSINFERTEDQLDDQEIAAVVTAFYRLKANAWLRRQLAVSMPRVKRAVAAARDNGERPDVAEIARLVLVDQQMLELE